MYNSYADDIFRYLLVRVRDQALAEDLTADTFTKAWLHLESFDFEQARPWLYKIAKNTMTDHWRKKRAVVTEVEVEVVSDAESIEEQLDKQASAETIKTALATLPEEMRSVVTMRFMLGYSAKKTGESLGMAEGNVRVIQYRALKKLKEVLS
ncbi:sigma-70 family RNA polymerase sigma factor [Candidatus Saccharibacteria bacterium]|nr:sigma-70 family RNA polymerase sigma factor [Candidatus Saccharibacteria bacterium]